MKTIAVDIDDTLYSFHDLAREVWIEVAMEHGDKRIQRGAYVAWGEWRSPSDVDDTLWPEVIARCHSDEKIMAQIPFPGAAETLNALVDQGYHLHFISNRAPEARAATDQWLIGHDFPWDEEAVKLTCTFADKQTHLRGCQFLIDDRPKTLVQFVYDFTWKLRYGSTNATMARKGFGLYRQHNIALTDIPGVKLAPNWRLLRQYLTDQNVLRSPVGSHR